MQLIKVHKYLLAVIFIFSMYQGITGSLDKRISISVQNETISQVLNYIESHYGINFSYDISLFNEVETITISVKNIRLSDFLRKIINDDKIGFYEYGGLIVFHEAKIKYKYKTIYKEVYKTIEVEPKTKVDTVIILKVDTIRQIDTVEVTLCIPPVHRYENCGDIVAIELKPFSRFFLNDSWATMYGLQCMFGHRIKNSTILSAGISYRQLQYNGNFYPFFDSLYEETIHLSKKVYVVDDQYDIQNKESGEIETIVVKHEDYYQYDSTIVYSKKVNDTLFCKNNYFLAGFGVALSFDGISIKNFGICFQSGANVYLPMHVGGTYQMSTGVRCLKKNDVVPIIEANFKICGEYRTKSELAYFAGLSFSRLFYTPQNSKLFTTEFIVGMKWNICGK